MAAKLGISEQFILTIYQAEVKKIATPRSDIYTREDRTKTVATATAKFAATIISSICDSLTQGRNVSLVKLTACDDGVANLLNTIFNETFGVDITEQEKVGYQDRQCKLFWKQEGNKELRLLFGVQVPPEFKSTNPMILTLRQNDKYSDFKFKVEDKEFKVHKAVLAASTSYFDALFSTGMAESKATTAVPFGDSSLKASVFDRLLTYIYTREVDFSNLSLEEVVELANTAKLTLHDELFSLCIAHLRLTLAKETLFDTAYFAYVVDSKILMTTCKFHLTLYKDLVDSCDFSEMNAKQLMEYYEMATLLESTELKEKILAILMSKIDEKHFEEVCSAACSAKKEEVKKPLQAAAYSFATKNLSLFEKTEMQKAREAYTALMTGLGKPSQAKPTEL